MFQRHCQKQHDRACYPCQENFSLPSSRSPHFRERRGKTLTQTEVMFSWLVSAKLRLSCWEKLFCPLFHSSLYAQSTPSTTAQSTNFARTHSKRRTQSSFLTAAWTGTSVTSAHCQQSFTQGTHCGRLESWLSPTSFVVRDTWQYSCTWLRYFRTFYLSGSQFVTTTTP